MYASLCLHTLAQVRSDLLLVGWWSRMSFLGQTEQERPQWKEFGLGAAGAWASAGRINLCDHEDITVGKKKAGWDTGRG